MSTTLEESPTRFCAYGTYQRATRGYSISHLAAHPRLMVRLCHTRLNKKTHLSREQRKARHLYIRSAFSHLGNDLEIMKRFKF